MIRKEELLELLHWKLGLHTMDSIESYEEKWMAMKSDPNVAELMAKVKEQLHELFRKSNLSYLLTMEKHRHIEVPAQLMLNYYWDGESTPFLPTPQISFLGKWLQGSNGIELDVFMDKLEKIADEFLPNETVNPTGLSLPNATEPVAEALPEPVHKVEDVPQSAEPSPEIKLPVWNHEPIQPVPDMHDESYSLSLNVGTEFRIVGARVRGKKHKHDGTNCDDWFEADTSGAWTVIAVSDGAGSKKFSRIGAKESCRAAADHLKARLSDHLLAYREAWTPQTFERDPETGTFREEDLELVQQALHEALHKGHEAVQAAANTRNAGERAEEYRSILGRDLTANDLSATLLLAVHTVIEVEGQDYSFVLSCQIGDGASCVIRRNGTVSVLGVPDSGEFSGETEFLTSKKFLDSNYTWRKTYPFFGPIRALLVMTDGVADDYFPADPEMRRLLDDLIDNKVMGAPSEDAEEMKVDDRLRNWLDTYYVRGSFDDRTLVVLAREEAQ